MHAPLRHRLPAQQQAAVGRRVLYQVPKLTTPCSHAIQGVPRTTLPGTASATSNGSSNATTSTTTSSSSNSTQQGSSPGAVYYTCRRCRQRFAASENHAAACRYHPQLYSGGEVAKAVGFVRQSAAPEHQLQAVMGRRGLMRFWDCCGAEDESAPGCCASHHVTYDEDLNAAMGWGSMD